MLEDVEKVKMSEQKYRERENLKRNQSEILELNSAIIEMKKNPQRDSKGNLSEQNNKSVNLKAG